MADRDETPRWAKRYFGLKDLTRWVIVAAAKPHAEEVSTGLWPPKRMLKVTAASSNIAVEEVVTRI
jgi:hypothetical protein